jgi:hypothetical protein
MALGATQPITEMTTRNLPEGMMLMMMIMMMMTMMVMMMKCSKLYLCGGYLFDYKENIDALN